MAARRGSGTPLTEKQKIEMLLGHGNGIPKRGIAAIMGKSESTIRSFLKSYESHDALSLPRGRPRHNFPLLPAIVADMTKRLDSEPRLFLRNQIAEFENPVCGIPKLWRSRHPAGYHF
jgi:hypothetical protein